VVIEHVARRSPHLHPKSEEIVYVVAGTGRVWLNGVFHPVSSGSWYRIPLGTPHATLADPGETMSLVCFFPHDDLANNIEELDLLLEADKEKRDE
jgi:quercetin dioxygenase-like cupin family protein